ncbi:LuxR family transcriptional regulator [Streptomyces sp. E5N91]|uniref:helix-turn-helix transcriptional regulator n=1 Tax=Streptomyces sp. E5N91 TaxID=1851996 RepID=UPI001EE8C640|nr:LuxR family transcriptional regulator [Streptomyces sp. E5N91]
MIGRDDELAALASFMTSSDGDSLVLRGEAGVGKSTLVDHAARLAAQEKHTLISLTGVEAESQLPYSGLHQCLHPLRGHMAEQEERHRAVFDVVFGLGGAEPPPSAMTLGIAVLDLLSRATVRGPLTLLIDDGQWLDNASAEVCGFVARRLSGSTVKMLITLRSDVTSRFDSAALPELSVRELPAQAARQFLERHRPQLDEAGREAVLEHARGNPLALLELPPYGMGGALGRRAVPQLSTLHAVSLPRRLQHVYGTRIERLEAGVREQLLRGALDGAAATGASPAGEQRYRMRDVAEAVAGGLLEVDPVTGELLFRHPLVRSTVVQMATPNQRRAAHAELACVHGENLERRAAHLAASVVDPDEKIAAVLEAAARSATRRGGASAAVTWLTRAAELSEDSADRCRRLDEASHLAGQAALLDEASHLAGQAALLAEAEKLARRSSPHSGTSGSLATAVTSAYSAFYQEGDVHSAHRRLATAIEGLRDDPGGNAAGMLTHAVDTLLAVAQYSSDAVLWRRTENLLDSLGDRVHPLSALYRDAWGDFVKHGAGLRERVEQAFTSGAELAPWDVSRLGVSALLVDSVDQYRTYLRRAVERERESGAVSSVMTMLRLIMMDQMSSGAWDEAEESGQQALELALAHGFTLFAHHSRACLGMLAARRGQLGRARDLQAAVDAWARPRGVKFLTQTAEAIGAAAALSGGDYEAAYLYAVGITTPGSFEPYTHQASRSLLDLVEAAMATGRQEHARRHALAARDAELSEVSPRLALMTYGALSTTSSDPTEADDMYARAAALPAAPSFPFEFARIALAHGTRLRQRHSLQGARQVLMRACETFDRLGAGPWAERARGELRASGVSARVPASHPEPLSPQERQIADLAARGLTNREIGARTHLSPRTVSSHLYRIFPKLGITSRAALRDALGHSPGISHQ